MSNKPHLLIVDDERNTRNVLERFLRLKYQVTQAKNGLEAIELFKGNSFDLILTDLKMPGADGMAVVLASKELNPSPPCIVATAYGSIETAVDVVKAGAFDFIVKPVDIDNLKLKLEDALTIKKSKKAILVQQNKSESNIIIGESTEIKQVLKIVEKIASARTTVLITGESGTGKELIAESLHNLSGRSGKFIPVNCAALSDSLLESELFGHEKGAFTGAIERKMGRFERAKGGTIFLDEIAEIDMQTQVKLLRILENRVFERVGGAEIIKSDARVVTATNRNLSDMVKNGEFREDLYFRLNVLNIQVPSLRSRKDDIPLLINYFLNFFAKENDIEEVTITDDAISILKNYSWYGNIRELKNTIEKMVVLSDSWKIGKNDIPFNIQNNISDISKDELDINKNAKELIISALDATNGNITKAADKLGINRRTLHRKLKKYDI